MPQQNQPNPYEFITNPGQPAKQPMLGGSMKSRIIIVVGGLLLLVIAASAVSYFMSAESRANAQNLKNLVARQEEIIRVADIGIKDALSPGTKGFATTVSFSTRSSQIAINERLTASGTKIKPEEKSSKFNRKTEEILKSASANNRYDEALTDNLKEQIVSYLKDLKSVYNSQSNEKTRSAILEACDSASIIVGEQTNYCRPSGQARSS